MLDSAIAFMVELCKLFGLMILSGCALLVLFLIIRIFIEIIAGRKYGK